jgi:protein-glutamine gamma-glutamyltransferase
MRLRLDALHQLWRERILRFDHNSQNDLLVLLRIPEPDGQKLVMVLAGAFTLALVWLTWQVRRKLQPPVKDPLIRAYARLCRKLAAVGLARRPHEGAEAYGARIAAVRPDLAACITDLCRRYTQLRYGGDRANDAQASFMAAVRNFHPRRTAPTDGPAGRSPAA